MESSSGEKSSNSSGIEPVVGGLVWVRRRNGSWWPGRIMGLDELPQDCVMSSRSGTPVKLLGRDDASVDWYNLEKSKRVKPFRCGEYDDCIEKAKAAASSNKKAVKYARREDAILHALEIESAHQPKEGLDFRPDMGNSMAEQNGRLAKHSPIMSSPAEEDGDYEDVSTSGDSSNSAHELPQSGISFEEPNHINVSKLLPGQRRRRRTPNDSEDDGTEGSKRMRGLEDLGIGVVSKGKAQAGEPLEHLPQVGIGSGNCISSGNLANGSKDHFSSLKRKRTPVANVHEFLKRKNRRRPLMKVLESSAMVTVPVMFDELDVPGGLPEVYDSKARLVSSSKRSVAVSDNTSDGNAFSCENGFLDASEHAEVSKETGISNLPGLLDNDSCGGLYDVPFVREQKPAGCSRIFAFPLYGKPQDCALGRTSQSSQAENILIKTEGTYESVSTSSAAVHRDLGQEIENSTSKWKSKRKRNSRHATKYIKQEPRNSEELNGESDGYMEHLHGSSVVPELKFDFSNKVAREDRADGFPDWRKHASCRELYMRGAITGVKLPPHYSPIPQRSLLHRQSRLGVQPTLQVADFPGKSSKAEPILYDVSLEVKASYRPQHVPLVSLMSKLNGKAIIGHPITVEALDDGSCDELINNIEWYPISSNGDLDDMDYVEHIYTVKPNYGSGRISQKHLMSQPRFPPGKSSKTRRTGLLSKKTRRLSSLTGFHKSRVEKKSMLVKSQQGPAAACIPLKVVFSRLGEAVNKPKPPVLTSTDSRD